MGEEMGQIMLAQHGNGSLDKRAAMGMYRLRHEVFHDRLGWEVTTDNGMEHDEFDLADPVYVRRMSGKGMVATLYQPDSYTPPG